MENSSVVTSVGNDYEFENIFSRELDALARKEDVFIGISTSGSSKNIIRVVQNALNKGLKVYYFTGNKGGDVAKYMQVLQSAIGYNCQDTGGTYYNWAHYM